MPKTYSIYEAKARFSELIRMVQKHARVIITHRGNPIAQILPIQEEPLDLSQRIALLEKEGQISPTPKESGIWEPVAKKNGALKRFLEDRD